MTPLPHPFKDWLSGANEDSTIPSFGRPGAFGDEPEGIPEGCIPEFVVE